MIELAIAIGAVLALVGVYIIVLCRIASKRPPRPPQF